MNDRHFSVLQYTQILKKVPLSWEAINTSARTECFKLDLLLSLEHDPEVSK